MKVELQPRIIRVSEAEEEIEHLQDAVIRQGQMQTGIVNITKGEPKNGSLHSTHDAVESVERLQARVAELESENTGGTEQ